MFDPDRVDSVAFDSFSTLVDVESSREAIAEYTDSPLEVAQVWRERALLYSVLANSFHEYETYHELHRMGLEYANEAYDLGISDAEIAEINEVYHDLDPFDDVEPVCTALRDAGYDLYVLSNGDPAMLDAMLDTLGIEELLTDVISAEEIKTFKPEIKLYRHTAERAGTPVDRMAHISAAYFDAQGAQNAGMQGVWLDRKGTPADPYGESPTLTVGSLHEFADALGID